MREMMGESEEEETRGSGNHFDASRRRLSVSLALSLPLEVSHVRSIGAKRTIIRAERRDSSQQKGS